MNNTGIIITLAYPETIVMVAVEWYSSFLKYLGVGKKNYVRAGHAALVLIEKKTGVLEYHDFGRYITSKPNGRVRGKITDHELEFSLVANINDNTIENINEILKFFATHPKLTHGDGKLIASVCSEIDYDKARSHIDAMQGRQFIRYAAFIKDASNCARFVTYALIDSVTNQTIRKRLIKSTKFTPSTIGNVIIADTENRIYEVSDLGEISKFKSTVRKENLKYFLDKLENHIPNYIGTLYPKTVGSLNENAQWLEGIAAGAWFELFKTDNEMIYRYKRISPEGRLDVEGLYKINDSSFIYDENYAFVHYSNCHFFNIKQEEKLYRFELIEKIN